MYQFIHLSMHPASQPAVKHCILAEVVREDYKDFQSNKTDGIQPQTSHETDNNSFKFTILWVVKGDLVGSHAFRY